MVPSSIKTTVRWSVTSLSMRERRKKRGQDVKLSNWKKIIWCNDPFIIIIIIWIRWKRNIIIELSTTQTKKLSKI